MGYQGGELNALGGYYIVRQSDAHAWTEVWLEDEGWVRVDAVAAVAPERVALGFDGVGSGGATAAAAALRASWGRQAALFWDAVEHALAGVDHRLRPGAAARLARVARFRQPAPRATLRRLARPRRRRDRRAAARLEPVPVVARAGAHRVDAAALCFAAFVRRLQRLDVPARAPSEGPRAYAERAADALPHAAARDSRRRRALSSRALRARRRRRRVGGARGRGRGLSRRARLSAQAAAALDSRVVKNWIFGQRSCVRDRLTVLGAR